VCIVKLLVDGLVCVGFGRVLRSGDPQGLRQEV
jgi:hypothetical protein